MYSTAHTTNFDAMGLKTQSPFQWRVAPPEISEAERKRLAYNAYQRQYEAKKRKLERDAKRVNPESNICKAPVLNSTRARR